tara:strand:+ start:254 stop:610 length:357 start_codon:yes stop_codon:yes gene_type:complete
MNRYQVWLQRDNGIPKTVIVDDCYYEDEARLLAESQYGLPVSKVLYQGRSTTGQYQHELEPPYPDYNKNIFRGRYGFDLQVISSLAGLLLLFVFIQYWYLFVGAVIIGTVYSIVRDQE